MVFAPFSQNEMSLGLTDLGWIGRALVVGKRAMSQERNQCENKETRAYRI